MIRLVGGIESFSVSFSPSSELDVVAYVICGVHESTLVDGDFTPSASNMLNFGAESSFNYPSAAPGTWYVRVCAIDSFEDVSDIQYDNQNWSALYSVKVDSGALEIPPEYIDTIRPDFIMDGIRMYFGTNPYDAAYVNTMYWDARVGGQIVRGSSTYTITGSGSFAGANGKFIMAKLDKATHTASFMTPVPFSAGVPALVDNADFTVIMVGITSSAPPTGLSNNVVYLRQANSMDIEAALIRNLRVSTLEIDNNAVTVSVGMAGTSATIDSLGQPVQVLLSCTLTMGTFAMSDWVTGLIELKRDDTVIKSYPFIRNGYDALNTFAVAYSDLTPGAGEHTYSFNRVVTYASSTWNTLTIDSPYIGLTGLKR